MTTKRSHRNRRVGGEDGAVLVFAMIVLMVFGLILGAVFNGTGAGERSTPYTRAHLSNTYAADAGIDVGLQQLRQSSSFCATAQSPSADLQLTGLANGHDVTVRCRVVHTVNSIIGAAGYAAIIMGKTGPTISTTSGASTKVISGPVFLSGDTDLKQPLVVHAGDIDNLCFQSGTGGAVRPATAAVTFDEGYQWSTCTDTQPSVQHTLPPEPCTAAPGNCTPSRTGYLSTDGQCRIFLPGRYTSAPSLDTGHQNYFLSGTYHFAGTGGWPVKNAAVIAGLAVPPASNAADCTKTTPTTVAGGVAVSTLPGGTLVSGSGATFVFSGNSFIDMQPGGSLEVFPRLRAASDPITWTERLSIVALPTESPDPNPTWPRSTVASSSDILQPQPGNTTTELVHGIYYTPAQSLTVQATNSVVSQFVGGVVVYALTIGESASAISLQIGLQPVVSDRVVRLTSTSNPTDGEKPVTAVAVVGVATSAGFPVTVLAWRNSAPDF
jgi:Tfp pilus assembly protein PilX